MNVEIGAEAALFPEKEYINGIFIAVWLIYEGNSEDHKILRLSKIVVYVFCIILGLTHKDGSDSCAEYGAGDKCHSHRLTGDCC